MLTNTMNSPKILACLSSTFFFSLFRILLYCQMLIIYNYKYITKISQSCPVKRNISFLSGPHSLVSILYMCLTEEESSISMSSIVIEVCHICGTNGVKGGILGERRARGRMGLVGMRQLILMGLLWAEVPFPKDTKLSIDQAASQKLSRWLGRQRMREAETLLQLLSIILRREITS
jgi:hypothetical protein